MWPRLTQAALLATSTLLMRGLFSLASSRPALWSLLVLWASAQMWYLMVESSAVHASQRSENKFWMLSACFLMSSLLFAPDSPVSVSNNFARFFLVFLTTFASHLVHKNAHRKQLANRSQIHHSRSYVNAIGRLAREGGEEITDRVNGLLSRLDSPYIPGGVKRYLDSNYLEYERQLLQMFRTATREELNYLVLHSNLNAVLYHLKNRTKPTNATKSMGGFIAGKPAEDNRNALVELLARERIADLTTSAKASVLDAIQVVGLMKNPYTRDAMISCAANIVLSTSGAHLSNLKSITDSKASVNSMHQLIYNDVNDAVRKILLDHFGANATPSLPFGRKVISDVDDTLLSSGGRYPAGIDATYPRHIVYPGAGAFYQELDMQGRKLSHIEDGDELHGGNLAFLSARPHVYKDVSEKRVYAKFERLLKSKALHAMPTLLPGDLESGQAYLLRGDFEPMAKKKLRNMLEYYSVYPEYSHVFVCDNGQADVRAAELMKERMGDALECVFVHEVQPRNRTFGYTEASPQMWRTKNICFYKTFAGAALLAFERKFIDRQGLLRICRRAADDFEAIPVDLFRSGALGREIRRIELVSDLVRVREALEAASASAQRKLLKVDQDDDNVEGVFMDGSDGDTVEGYDDDFDYLPAQCLYEVGTQVWTRFFGEGYVRDFRPRDGVYELELLRSMRGYFVAPELSRKPFPRSLGMSGMFEGNAAESSKAIPVGSKVSTPYGEGVVRRFRPSDQVFEVQMSRWKAVCFLQEAHVAPLTSVERWSWKRLFKRVEGDKASAPGSAIKPSSKPLPKFEVGSKVQTLYGMATVNECDDVKVVVTFDGWRAVGFLNHGGVTAIPVPKRSSPLFEGFSRNLSDTARAAISFMRLPSHHSAASPDTTIKKRLKVATVFGPGELVEEARPTDGVITVALDWGATAYLQVSAIHGTAPRSLPMREAKSSPRAAFGKILRALTSG